MGFVLHPLEEKIEKMTIRQVKSGWQVDIQPGGVAQNEFAKPLKKKPTLLHSNAMPKEKHKKILNGRPRKKMLDNYQNLLIFGTKIMVSA